MAESKYWYAIVDVWGSTYRYYGTLNTVVEQFYAAGHTGPATVAVTEFYDGKAVR